MRWQVFPSIHAEHCQMVSIEAQISQIVANSMAKFTGQLCGDFQLGGYLSSHTFEDHLSISDRPEKNPQEKHTSESLVMIYTRIICSLV